MSSETDIATVQEAERACIAACLHDAESAQRVVAELHEEDFTAQEARESWRAVRSVVVRGETANLLTVVSELRTSKRIDAAGGPAYVAALDLDLPYLGRLGEFVDIVKRATSRRRMLAVLQESISVVTETQTPVESIAQRVTNLMRDELSALDVLAPRTLGSDLAEAMRELDENLAPPIPTGFGWVDRKLAGGPRRGELVVIAARPGMGKTAITEGWAYHFAQQNHRTAVVNYEMRVPELMHRLTSHQTKVPLAEMRERRINSYDRERIKAFRETVEMLPLWHFDVRSVDRTSDGIASAVRRLQRGAGLDVIVIDTLNRMKGERSRDNRVAEISDITGNLKTLAQEANVLVVLVCQLNRGLTAQTDKRPQLHDLKESGSIEQDADTVLMLHREHVFDLKADEREGELFIRKNRNGEIGFQKLHWNGPCVHYTEADSTR